MHSILMPTEIMNRDLDFQVMLAARAVKPGVQVFLGRYDAIHRMAREVEGGTYIGKAFVPYFPTTDLAQYKFLKHQGFTVLHLDDEGAVFPGDESEWINTLKQRLDPAKISGDDFVCVWGDWQRDFYRGYGASAPERVRTTGHPRFDLLRSEKLREYYAPAAAKLKDRLGDYVLLNTNIQIANNGLGLANTFTKRLGYDVADPAKKANAINFWAHTTKILINNVKLVHQLADQFPNLRIVVRPHPSEDQQYYRTVFTGVKNVSVLHEGSVIPWLLASRALIHDGCTTGIEAALAGVPIINYKSVEDDRYDVYLPNLFGTKCTNEEEVIAAVRQIVGGTLTAPALKDLPIRDQDRALFANFDAETFDRLLAVVDEARSASGAASLHALRARAREGAAATVERAKNFARRVVPRGRVERAYSRNKFYGFKQAGMQERILNAERVTGRRLKLQILSDNLVSLTA